MNLKKLVKELNKVFNEWGIRFNTEIKRTDSGEKVQATANLTLKGADDDIYADFNFYPNGVCQYLFTFDKLAKTPKTLDLVNTFNEEALWFKAFIDDKFLRLSHIMLNMTEDMVAVYTDRVLDNLTDDDLKEYLLPLTRLTEE